MKTNSILSKILLAVVLSMALFFAANHFEIFSTKKNLPEPEVPNEKRFSIPTKEFNLDSEIKPKFNLPKQRNILSLDSTAFYKVMKEKVGYE